DKPAGEPQILNPDKSLTIDEVVLVGGASRMPMVAKMIRNKLRIEPRLVDPDLAVAKGAAIYAGILNNKPDVGIRELKSRGTRSYGVGIRIKKESGNAGREKKSADSYEYLISNLIKTNENMIIENRPFVGKYQTNENNDSVSIKIYENESDDDRIEIGSRTPLRDAAIRFGEIKPEGTPVDIFLSRDADGIVSLRAECAGKECKIEFGTV
ncbi:MAG: Hsp70 family protein, partial [Prevotellaceae bacterium]|nr:Hsp70 family protein [Prevotellaceae bacterium]